MAIKKKEYKIEYYKIELDGIKFNKINKLIYEK